MSDKVRLGVIGVGGMGSGHAGYIKGGEVQRCELTAVCDIDPKRLDNFPDLPRFEDSRELIRSGLVDAVLIATPHYEHTTIGIDALQQGLHVLTEKPIAVHKADAQRMIDAWQGTNLKFQAMFQMRTSPAFRKMKELIASGELGEITRVCWIATNWFRTEAYYASGGWRATWSGEGGGILLNQCPHNMDMLYWLVGAPSKISAHCGFGRKHNIEVEDEVTAYLEYPNGATGVFISSTGEAPGSNIMEICGERGKISSEGNKVRFIRNEMEMTEFSRTSTAAFASPPVWNIEIPVGGGGDHKVITQNFVNAILDGEPLIAPAQEGIHSVEMACSMLYSAFTNAPVEFPLDAAAYEAKLKELIATSRYVKPEVKAGTDDISASFH